MTNDSIHPALSQIAADARIGYDALLAECLALGFDRLVYEPRLLTRIDRAGDDAGSIGMDAYARQFNALSQAAWEAKFDLGEVWPTVASILSGEWSGFPAE